MYCVSMMKNVKALSKVISLAVPLVVWAAFAVAAPVQADSGQPVSGNAVFASASADLIKLATGLGGLYLTLSVVLNLGQANLEVIGGRYAALGEARDRLLPAAVCFAVCASAQSLSGEAVRIMQQGGDPTSAAATVAVWRALAEFVARTVLLGTGVAMSAGFALGGFTAQIGAVTGQADTLGQASIRLGLIAVTAGLTFASVEIAHLIIQVIQV